MSDLLIRRALEIKLAALTPAVDIAYENDDYQPVEGTPYMRAELIPAQPENPTQDAFRRLLGIFQVTLMYPQGPGAKDATTQAEAIRTWFPKGLSLTNGGIVVIIDKTPYIMGGFQDGTRWSVPVRVPYICNLS